MAPLNTSYNKLAWWLKKEYGVSLKWAMKTAYCLRKVADNPEHLKYKPGSPLLVAWDPANVLKFIHVLRCQSRQSSDAEKAKELVQSAEKLYSRYMSLGGVGVEQVSSTMDGEAMYWASKFYVDSFAAKERYPGCAYIKLELPYGESVTTPWFNH
jgi:hypothetical protein